MAEYVTKKGEPAVQGEDGGWYPRVENRRAGHPVGG